MELIRITEQNGQKVVSARELHSFLKSRRDFSTWIKGRIEKYGLIENEDYTTLTEKGERAIKVEYALSLDAAKELSMVEGNPQGKQARKFFIECEKMLNGPKSEDQKLLESMKFLQKKITEGEAKLKEATKTIEIQAPKVEYYDQVLNSESTYNINLIAKELGFSARSLNKILEIKKIQYSQRGVWVLYSKYQDLEYTKTKTHVYSGPNDEKKTAMLTVWTEKGREFIHSILKERPTAITTKNNKTFMEKKREKQTQLGNPSV